MLDLLFAPRSVAVIGASSRELHIGNRIIRNLLDFGYKGGIYPINPKADRICGFRAYKSILEISEQVDVVHIVIPAIFVPKAVEDCGKKGVKYVIINSGGFSESDDEGILLEKKFMEKAKKYNVRILGPNCQGIINSDNSVRAYCNFTFTFPKPGNISIVALSGGVAEMIHRSFSAMNVGTRMYASNGNACDVSISEFIRYFGSDDSTKVIVTYVEGLKDPKDFMDSLSSVTMKKPVLAMKAGRTIEGAKAAASHTGGLVKKDMIADFIFKKSGVLSFQDESRMINAAVAFSLQPVPNGNRVGIITNTGGPAVIATDVLVNSGLEISKLSNKTKSFLNKKLHPEASIGNPVDVLATGTSEHYMHCLDAMMSDDGVDCIFMNFVTPFFVDTESIAREIVKVNVKKIKPIICNLITNDEKWKKTVDILIDGGIPCFSLPSDAAYVLGSMVEYRNILNFENGTIIRYDDIKFDIVDEILTFARKNHQKILRADQVYRILNAYGIFTPKWRLADNLDDVVAVANEIGYPIVLKVDSVSVLHKSDVGGVVIGISDEVALRSSVYDMMSKIKDDDIRFFIQEYVPGVFEFIIGARFQNELGHVIMFGLGGVFVEVFNDVVFNLAPISDVEAMDMVMSIRSVDLILGVRGHKKINRSDLIEIIQRLSQLVCDFPQIEELDFNPVIASSERVNVVDARILLNF